MLSSSDVKMAFCDAIINGVSAITLKTINDAKVHTLNENG